MAYNVNDLVQVRAKGTTGWFDGEVTTVTSSHYEVTLDMPTLSSVLYGSVPSRYATDQNITKIKINKSTEYAGDDYIRDRV